MDESLINIREEMELIKIRQQELVVEGGHGHERELWKLQIVWDYLRDKYIITTRGNGQLH